MSRTATRPAESEIDSSDSDLASITDVMIANQTDSGSFSRGKTYYRGHRIFSAVRRENTLRARCHGSSGGPYVVEATLARSDQGGKQNPVSYLCTCPRGGFCKHVVALLLTWIHEPESFGVRPPLADLLAHQDRDALISLIETMVRANPDLEELLDLPVSTTVSVDDPPVDEAAIRRQIAAAMPDEDGYDDDRYLDWNNGGYGNDDGYGIPASDLAKLERIVSLGEAYAEAGHWHNTLRLCATLVEEAVPHLAAFQDESGEIGDIIIRCDRSLSVCLDAQAESAPDRRLSTTDRARLIDALLRIWETDVEAGGLDLSQFGLEAIVRGATAEERERAVESAREVLASLAGDSLHRTWEKQAAIALLDLLRGEAGFSDEELLNEYREAGLWSDAASLLVRMDRIDEAVALATRRLPSASALTVFADRILELGDAGRQANIITLVDDRLWENEGKEVQNDQILRGWLERRYAEYGQPAKALELVRERFKTSPSKAVFDNARRIALLPDQPGNPWPALRKELFATLKKRGDWAAIVEIHLEDGEISEAIAAVDQAEKARRSGHGGSFYLWGVHPQGYTSRVAAAAETSHPADAARLYRRMADEMIAARNRESYKQAAIFLARVKHLLETTGPADSWPALISELRLRHKTLRALREELDALGLQ